MEIYCCSDTVDENGPQRDIGELRYELMIRKTTMNSFKRYELYNFFPVMAGLTIKIDLKVT